MTRVLIQRQGGYPETTEAEGGVLQSQTEGAWTPRIREKQGQLDVGCVLLHRETVVSGTLRTQTARDRIQGCRMLICEP